MRAFVFFLIAFVLVGCKNDPHSQHSQENSQRIERLELIIELYEKGKIDSCIKVANDFVADYKDDGYGWQMLSSAYLAKESDSLALNATHKSLSIDSTNHVALMNMGVLLDVKGFRSKAEGYYVKSINQNDSFTQAYSNYAANRLRASEYAKAVRLGEKAVALANNSKDKGVLCLSYHKADMINERDSLFNELKELGYKNLNGLKEIFNN